jgi:hypothetical protein
MRARPELPPATGDEDADVAAFLAWELACERIEHPDRFEQDGTRKRKPLTYYLGARPNWLADLPHDVPLMVPAHTLARYRDTESDRFKVQRWGNWFGDSGAFMALTGSSEVRGERHPWWMDCESYGALWTRFVMDVGMPDFVAPQDWPCEPIVRERTGATVREHIEWTVENYLWLRENYPHVPWIPVLQGWEPADYLYCADLYEAAGVDLTAERVGLGSICRRGDVPEIVALVELLAARGYKLHGFGVKISALPIIGHLLASADSYAWSENARKNNHLLDGCNHRTRACVRDCPAECRDHQTDCRNCPRFAQAWRQRVLATVTTDQREGRVVAEVPAPAVVIEDGPAGEIRMAWPAPAGPPPRGSGGRNARRRRRPRADATRPGLW